MRFLFFLVTIGGSLAVLWLFVWAMLALVKGTPRQPRQAQVKPRTDGTAVITAGASIPFVPLMLVGVTHDTQVSGALVFFCSALYVMAATAFIVYTLCTRNIVFPWDEHAEVIDVDVDGGNYLDKHR